MTLKKSLISIVASAALIATITGCSSNGTTATTTTTTDPLISSSVTAVDGYIYNATAKAHYLADDNVTISTIALESTSTTKNVTDGNVTLGSNAYTLPSDTNDSVKDRIKFYSIATTASSTSGTTFTPAAYIEGDGVNGYDVNDTLLGTTVILTPATASIASPITNLIVLANAATFGTYAGTAPTVTNDLNTSVSTLLDANATNLATKLGLGDVNLLTADPVATAATNPTYRLVNALLKDASAADMTTILAATTPTTLAATLTTISGLASAAGTTLAGNLATLATAGQFTTANIAEMNIEKSVTLGVKTDTTAPVVTGKFPINSMAINNVLTSEFVAAGAKIDGTALNLDLNMTNVDGNISNQTFNLLISIEGNKANEAALDTNNSAAIYAKIPFELNSTSGALASSISDGTLVPFEVRNSNGSAVYSATDVNASSSLALTGVISHPTTTSVQIDVNTIIDNLITRADANVTGVTRLDTDGISSVKIYLQDVDGSVTGVTADGTGSIVLPTGDYSSLTGAITATSALKVLDLAKTDLRSTTTTANNAPATTTLAAAANSASLTHKTAANVIAADESGTTLLGNKVIINEDSGSVESILELTIADEGSETNSSVTVSGLPAWATVETATLVGGSTDAQVDFNVTIDGNATVTGHDATLLTFKVTDEFGKTLATSDVNTTLMFNHAPTALTATSSRLDLNSTALAGIYTFTTAVLTDSDGVADLNATASTLDAVTVVSGSSAVLSDANTSAVTVALEDNGSLTFSFAQISTANAVGTASHSVVYTVTDIYGAVSAEGNYTFDLNATAQ